MFARPRPKKLLAPPSKKRKRQHAIEEIKFDDGARAEYLTGFHKRKLQRARNAQEQAAERARQEKIDARRQVRTQYLPCSEMDSAGLGWAASCPRVSMGTNRTVGGYSCARIGNEKSRSMCSRSTMP